MMHRNNEREEETKRWIKELAHDKIRIEAEIRAIGFINAYGKTMDELVELEVRGIHLAKELNMITREIDGFVTPKKY